MPLLGEISEAVVLGDANKTVQLTRQALDSGIGPLQVFREALIPAMSVVGEKMQAGEYYIPEVLLSARAMRMASDVVKPLIVQSGGLEPTGKVVMGTVKGDLHDIGKNLVIMMLEGAGFQVTDLGTNVEPASFVGAVKQHGAQLVGLSALLTTTMLNMREVLEALKTEGIRQGVKVMIGGAPVDERFANELGADGYAPDAASAADLAKRLLGVPATR